MKQTVNKYAHLEYEVLHTLDISIAEYWLLDMVYHLSRDGWCYKSLNSIAVDMKMTKRGVAMMRDRLIEKGYLKKNIKGHLKTEVAYNKVLHLDNKAYNLVHEGWKKLPPSVEKSATKNNNRITIDNRNEKGLGYINALKAYKKIKGII